MATITKITKSAVDGMDVDPDKPTYLWDRSLPGFGVKCSPTGSKRYVVKYRANGGGRAAKQRWLTLGGHGPLTPDQARKMAQQSLAAIARGEDPQSEKSKRRGASSLSDIWDRYEKEHLPSRKENTQYDYTRLWIGVLKPKLGATIVQDLSTDDVDRLHKGLRSTPYRANRVRALLSRLMSLAEIWQHRSPGSNPCRQVSRFKEKGRNRYLSGEELKLLGATLNAMTDSKELSASAANAIRLLLLTGARLTEILSARWEWFDPKQKVIALPDSKTGEKLIFLSDEALAVLKRQKLNSAKSAFLFPGNGKQGRMINLAKPWGKVCEKAGLTGVRLHDLRHTAASVAVSQGASLPIIGRLLGHSQPQMTQRYAHVDSDPALLAANAVGSIMKAAFNTRSKLKPRSAPSS